MIRVKFLNTTALVFLVLISASICGCKIRTGGLGCEVPELTPTEISDEWIESHKANLTNISPDDCEERYCYACHVSADPHEPGMVDRHIKEYEADPKSCLHCHDHYDSCNECHQATWAHNKNTNKWPEHKEFFTEGERTNKSCSACHAIEFCNNPACHGGEEVISDHGKNWNYSHPMAAKKHNKSCAQCHSHGFCITCHQKNIFQFHDSTWGLKHGEEIAKLSKDIVMAGEQSCGNCHATKFCMECHDDMKTPFKYHDRKDWTMNHSTEATENEAFCISCHNYHSCNKCHKTLPHPENYTDTHGAEAMEKLDSCMKCHQQEYCADCHSKTPPKSHLNKNFKTDHAAAAAPDSKSCFTCHVKSKDCDSCHSYIPHPGDYMDGSKHGADAVLKTADCARCHNRDTCLACHDGMKPSSHSEDYMTEHGEDAKNRALCSFCHADDYCSQCH
ncbi:MAG TPA: hypothetical protein PLN69_04610 [bacterium]|nr:hypothetical protein [bacterium]